MPCQAHHLPAHRNVEQRIERRAQGQPAQVEMIMLGAREDSDTLHNLLKAIRAHQRNTTQQATATAPGTTSPKSYATASI
jgi:hypothetical protein